MTVSHALSWAAGSWAAAQPGDYDPASGKGPEWGKAAPVGLLIILLLGAAVYLLVKSMNRNLRKVPATFDAEQPAGVEAAADAPGNGSGNASAPAAGSAGVVGSTGANTGGATDSDGPAGLADPLDPFVAGSARPRRGRRP